MSLARIIIVAFALIHAVGLADLVMDDACGEACTDDGCGADCLPGDACRCHCPSTMPLLGGVARSVAKAHPLREVALVPAAERMHASPDPREILHVPKRAA